MEKNIHNETHISNKQINREMHVETHTLKKHTHADKKNTLATSRGDAYTIMDTHTPNKQGNAHGNHALNLNQVPH